MSICEWLFKPRIEVYNGNWSSSMVNRSWMITCIFVNPLTMGIVGILEGIDMIPSSPILIMVGFFITNLIQQMISERYWSGEVNGG